MEHQSLLAPSRRTSHLHHSAQRLLSPPSALSACGFEQLTRLERESAAASSARGTLPSFSVGGKLSIGSTLLLIWPECKMKRKEGWLFALFFCFTLVFNLLCINPAPNTPIFLMYFLFMIENLPTCSTLPISASPSQHRHGRTRGAGGQTWALAPPPMPPKPFFWMWMGKCRRWVWGRKKKRMENNTIPSYCSFGALFCHVLLSSKIIEWNRWVWYENTTNLSRCRQNNRQIKCQSN